MAQAQLQLPQNGSRLIRLVTDLTTSNRYETHKHFTERLAQLIDLSDSIALASAHHTIETMTFEPKAVTTEAVNGDFLETRRVITQSVSNSFLPDPGPGRIKLPDALTNTGEDAASACEPYLVFYAAHQGQIGLQIQRLQSRTREAATGLAPGLARLCVLDKTLGDPLAVHSRKIYGVIPRRLGIHFQQRFEECRLRTADQADQADCWMELHEQFCTEMRGLLLAEIETRLQPVLGLIEAINENLEEAHYE